MSYTLSPEHRKLLKAEAARRVEESRLREAAEVLMRFGRNFQPFPKGPDAWLPEYMERARRLQGPRTRRFANK
jgi:hypothetical protein